MKIGRVYANFQEDFYYTEHYLAKELYKENHETVFITSDKYLASWKKYLKTQDPAGFKVREFYSVHRLKAWNPNEKVIYKNPLKLWKLLFNNDFNILHLNAVGSFSTITILWMVLLKGKKAPKVFINDHTDTRTHSKEGRFANLYYLFFKINLLFLKNKIKKVITFSEIGPKILSKRFGLPTTIFSIIPLGYDQDNYFYDENIKNSEDKMVIGYAGKIEPSKRIDFLIKELDKLEIRENIKLIIAGIREDDYCDNLKEIAANSSFEIEFMPFLTTKELNNFYNYIDIAIFPGGISITTIETSACGTPVIIYESISNLEERVDNGRGELFKTDFELKECVHSYYELYKINSIANFSISEYTIQNYSWNLIKNKYLKIFKKYYNERKS
ncbi:glycosyltransferase family 4 protein [Polaribacter litorisediminis]|uniref:glycosyltransferase family 4 protein n=1 Tax=Polaribacter litorisediminis TaxID=1908341 RepID=UPI001CBC24EF|nr:glycosyltransferase family 4 protein [Polaribacter litorisediminis]UAM96597.1 glycosyltransferase family 4 protein [Polaribacter litorisediminis]